jgi:hypothetical protein
MFQKIGLFFTGLALAGVSAFADEGLTYDSTKVNTDLNELANSAISLFDVVVPVILAVVGLSILIAFVKKIRKS